jgi:putative DNA primase/helicase
VDIFDPAHPAYRNPTTGKAYRHTTNHHDVPPADPAPVQPYANPYAITNEPTIARLSAITSKPLEWVWPGWIPSGMLTILGGHVGDGKSTAVAGLVGALTTGAPLPDGTTVPPKNVLLLGLEDDPVRILGPRLVANRADPDRVFLIEPSTRNRPDVSLDAWWIRDIVEENEIDLVVLDPLADVLRGADRFSEGDLRTKLEPFMGNISRAGVAVLGVMRLPRSASIRRPAHSLVGATAIPAIARSVLMIAPEHDGTGSSRRLLQVVKSNAGQPPAPVALDIDAGGVVRWLGPVPEGIDERAADPRLAPSERRDAATYLQTILADGPVPAATIMSEARKVGFSEVTIRRAKKDLRIRSARVAAAWSWSLPDND